MRTRLTTAALIATAVIGLAACSSSNGDKSDSASRPSTPTPTAGVDQSAIDKSLGIPQNPTGKTKLDLFAKLNQIHPGVAQNENATLDNIRNECQTIDHSSLDPAPAAAARFEVTAAEAAEIVSALKDSGVCKDS